MRTRRRLAAASLVLLPVCVFVVWMIASPGCTWLEMTDTQTGRTLFSRCLPDGERVVLQWTNSLFRLPVTEVFVAGGGALTLTEIVFADPTGKEAPRVTPEDVEDLYHTGGPFRAEGLSRRFTRVTFRVGEIGDPTFHIGGRTIPLAREVGFGGAVLLTARPPTLFEQLKTTLGKA